MEDDGTCIDDVSSRSLANPRRVRVLTAYREGQLVSGVRREEQSPDGAGSYLTVSQPGRREGPITPR
jgi:hypothetical protein